MILEWQNILVEAAAFQMLKQLRQMFAIILIHRGPTEPLYLWTAHTVNDRISPRGLI